MTAAIYTHRPWKVAAILWAGTNFPDVEQFLTANVGENCEPRNESGEYNTVQFYAWGDDQEVDPGRWIVVHLGSNGARGEVMYPDDFRAAYEVQS